MIKWILIILAGIIIAGALAYKHAKGKFEKLIEKAASGDVNAQSVLGDLYYSGGQYEELIDVEQNYVKAYECYEKAANQGHAGAQLMLARMLEQGQAVQQSYENACIWYERAANQGIVEAQLKLAQMFEKGQGVQQSYENASEWYETAADKGNLEAQLKLAHMFEEGNGVTQDIGKSVHYYEQASSQDNEEAQFKLGMMYYNGSGVEQNYEKAYEYFEKAYNGNSEAEIRVDILNSIDDDVDDTQRYILADKLYNSYINEEPEALYKLGLYYEDCDSDTSIELLTKAADQNYIDAQYALGMMYYNGEYIKKDLNVARQWFEKAAINGHSDARYKVAMMLYTNGEEDEDSIVVKQAKRFLAHLADKGDVKAIFKIGIMAEKGIGIKQDLSAAYASFELAANKGYDKAKIKTEILNLVNTEIEKEFDIYSDSYRKVAESKFNYLRANFIYDSTMKGNKVPLYKTISSIYRSKAKYEAYIQCHQWIEEYASTSLDYEQICAADNVNKSFTNWLINEGNQSNVAAQYFLAVMYYGGLLVEQDIIECKKWAKKAADNDSDLGRRLISQLHREGLMSDEELLI